VSYPILDDPKLDRRIETLFLGEGGARRLDTSEIAAVLGIEAAEVATRLARFRDRRAAEKARMAPSYRDRPALSTGASPP
jgi:hypothetical protein